MKTLCPFCQVELQPAGAKAGPGLRCPKCQRMWTSAEAQNHVAVAAAAPTTAVKQVIACPRCAIRYAVPTTAGGRSLTCRKCRNPFKIPTVRAIYQPTPTSRGLPVRCRYCGRGFSVPQSAMNEWTMCPGCSVVAIAVAAQPVASSPPSQPPPSQPPSIQPSVLELDDLPEVSVSPPPSTMSLSSNDKEGADDFTARSSVNPHLGQLPMPWLIGLGVVGFVVLAMSVAIYFVIQSTWSRQSARSLVASTPLSGEELYPRLVRGTVLIASPQGMGSGFIVDSVNRLVITNYHVVGRQKRVTVVFPIYDSAGTLITDLKSYESHIQNTALRGNVLAVDPKRDLCLIQVEQLPTRAVSVPLAEHPAKPGAVVYSVGGSGAGDNLLWRLTKGTVRGRVQRQQFADFGSIDCMILETDAPVNPGDSGGPVVNDRCELVAVVSHHRLGNRLVSGNIDVEEVRHFLRTHSSRR